MTLVEYQQSYIFSSDEALGAVNKTSDGSTFTVNFNSPLSIPRKAVACTVELIGSTIWYNTPNISALIGNNVFRYIVSATPESFVIPDGLYSISALNDLIQREVVNAGYAADTIILTGDSATQRSVFIFGAVGVQVDLTLADTPFELLGFTQRLVPLVPSTSIGQSEVGDSIAVFNATESYLVHSTLAVNGIPINNGGANVLSDVPIDVSVGSQINFSPRNARRTAIDELVGNTLGSVRFWLTDQADRLVDTRNEVWTATVLLRYHLPV